MVAKKQLSQFPSASDNNIIKILLDRRQMGLLFDTKSLFIEFRVKERLFHDVYCQFDIRRQKIDTKP